MGNFVNRALGFTAKSFEGRVPEPAEFDDMDAKAKSRIMSLSDSVARLMQENHLDRALRSIMEFSSFFNQYFQSKEPWKGGPGTATCIYLSVNAARSLAISLSPFLPASSQKLWDQLGLKGSVRNCRWNDLLNLGVEPGHLLGEISPLFSRIDAADIAKYKNSMGADRK